MNYLFVGKKDCSLYFKGANKVKEIFNLENFNVDFFIIDNVDDYKTFLKAKRFDIIYYFLSNIDDINYLDEFVRITRKFSRASYSLLLDENFDNNIVKEKLYFNSLFNKIIYLNTAINNFNKYKLTNVNFDFYTSLFILANLYHLDLARLSKYDEYLDNEGFKKAILNSYLNPFESILFNKKIAFLGNTFSYGVDGFSFIEYLYQFNKFSYLKDCSNLSLKEKIEAIDIKDIFDLFVIEDDESNDIEKLVKSKFDSDVLIYSFTNNNYLYFDKKDISLEAYLNYYMPVFDTKLKEIITNLK